MIKYLNKVYFILIFFGFFCSISLYANKQNLLETELTDKDSINSLPALKINGDYISPKEGLDILELRELVIQKLKKDGVKGDINSSLKVDEITTKEIWDNNEVQLFKVNIGYAWIDGVAIVKNNEVLTILSGMPTEATFIADLDNDHLYEIYTNVFIGSGVISEDILGYNVASSESFFLSKRAEKDLHLYIDKEILKVEIRPYNKNSDDQNISIIELSLKENLCIDVDNGNH